MYAYSHTCISRTCAQEYMYMHAYIHVHKWYNKHICLTNSHRSGSGGALLRAEGNSRIEMVDCRVTHVTSDGEGGAVLVSNSSLLIKRSYFEGNTASDGGALALINRARGILTGIHTHTHTHTHSLSLSLTHTHTRVRTHTRTCVTEICTFTDSTMTQCSAGTLGGAVFVNSGSTCVMGRHKFTKKYSSSDFLL